MKYLKIKNQGEIEPQALTLMGASSKTGDSSKIGMFGSGNKYAIAYFVRNNIDLKIFTGKDEIKITTEIEKFRDVEFKVISINGQKTSLTTTMGKDWELWQAIREIYCNAIDEGNHSIEVVDSIDTGSEETHFYIEMTESVNLFMRDFDNYFTKNKTVIEENEIGQIMTCSDAYVNIYRKGIRCWDSKIPAAFDYNFNDIYINESRVVDSDWRVSEALWQLFIRSKDNEVIERIFKKMSNRQNLECLSSSILSIPINNASANFRNFVYLNKFAPMENGAALSDDELKEFFLIPSKVYDKIEELMNPENKAKAFSKSTKGQFFNEIQPTKLHLATMKRAEDFFKECDYSINYPIKVVQFTNKSVLGLASDETIYVSDIAIEKGVHDLCNTIIEEQIRLKYDAEDETRAFQTAAINEMLTVMKKAYAFPM